MLCHSMFMMNILHFKEPSPRISLSCENSNRFLKSYANFCCNPTREYLPGFNAFMLNTFMLVCIPPEYAKYVRERPF